MIETGEEQPSAALASKGREGRLRGAPRFQAGCKREPLDAPRHRPTSHERGGHLQSPEASHYRRHTTRTSRVCTVRHERGRQTSRFLKLKLNRVGDELHLRRRARRPRPGSLAPSFFFAIGFTFHTDNFAGMRGFATPRARSVLPSPAFFVGIVFLRFFFASNRGSRRLGPARCPVGVNTCAPTERRSLDVEMISRCLPYVFPPRSARIGCFRGGWRVSAAVLLTDPTPVPEEPPSMDEKSTPASNLSGASSLRSRK